MRKVGGAVVAALLVVGCSWPQYRGGPNRSGANPFAPGVTLASLAALSPAWTSGDHGILGDDVIVEHGRVVAPGSSALWALDAGTGADAWHMDRTFGHQTNDITAATTWSEGGGERVAVTQYYSDAISGTSYFQDIATTAELDLATGAVLRSTDRGTTQPPVASPDWVYFPQSHVIFVPIGLGRSELDMKLVARASDDSGSSFTVPLASPDSFPTGTAVDRDHLFVRTLAGVLHIPARGCAAPTCAPTWHAYFGGGATTGQLAIGAGTVFDLDNHGRLTALREDGCGATACSPLWTATLPGTNRGIAVAQGRVYVTNGSTLYAFDESGCGAATCTPQWTSTASAMLSSPSVVNDVVLAGTADGSLVAWDVEGCGTETCPVGWSQAQGGAVGPVTPLDHALVFPVGGSVRKLVVAGS